MAGVIAKYNSESGCVLVSSLKRNLLFLGEQIECDDDHLAELCAERLGRLIWLSYRKNFAPIAKTRITSDTGWGCMIRAGQMLIAETLQRVNHTHHLDITRKAEVIQRFLDSPECLFSVHSLVEAGSEKGLLQPGNWTGPNAVMQACKSITDSTPHPPFRTFIAMDGSLYTRSVDVLFDVPADKNASSTSISPVLVVIPLRLGLDCLPEEYHSDIQTSLSIPSCVGLIGGRPGSAYYFVGCHDKHMLYLDPHTTQLSVGALTAGAARSFQPQKPRWVSLDKMDATICLGFLCSSMEDWLRLKEDLTELTNKGMPLFSIQGGHAPNFDFDEDDDDAEDFLVEADGGGSRLRHSDEGEDEDDFEVIERPAPRE